MISEQVYQALAQQVFDKDQEIERLRRELAEVKALWFADADPKETRFAAEYAVEMVNPDAEMQPGAPGFDGAEAYARATDQPDADDYEQEELERMLAHEVKAHADQPTACGIDPASGPDETVNFVVNPTTYKPDKSTAAESKR